MNRIDTILARIYDYMGFLKDLEFCEKYQIKPNTLSTWKKRDKIPYELLEDISQNENLSLDWLLTGFGGKHLENKVFLPTIQNKALSTDVVSVNFYPDIYAAAGYGAINTYEHTAEVITFDKKFIDMFMNVRHYDLLDAIHIVGDSMEPYVFNGEIVIVERNENPKNGDIVVANINGEVYVKRYQADPFKKWIKLVSENSIYPDIHLETKEEINLLYIVGIVRAKMRAF